MGMRRTVPRRARRGGRAGRARHGPRRPAGQRSLGGRAWGRSAILRGLPAILAATSDKATVRRRAVLALAPFDGPEVTDALERARTDRDWQVRQAAEDLTGRM